MEAWAFYENEKPILSQWRTAIRAQMSDLEGVYAEDVTAKTFDYANKIGIMFKCALLHQNIGNVRWPCNWVQAFKERWFPLWLKKYFPVRYKTIEVSALYPYASLPNPVFKARATQYKSNLKQSWGQQ